jgi:hypothetical protein
MQAETLLETLIGDMKLPGSNLHAYPYYASAGNVAFSVNSPTF